MHALDDGSSTRSEPATTISERPDGIKTLEALFRERSQQIHVRPGEVILLHGQPADAVYRVVAGTVRCCTITDDGCRQIFQFARSDEFLGLVDVDRWHFTAEAVDYVILKRLPRDVLEAAIAADPGLQRTVRKMVADQLALRERQLIAIAYLQAEERLLWFLRAFAETRGKSGFIALPMTRHDIGDHLGLTLETVCRAFGTLRRKGLIEMRGSNKFRLLEREECLAA